MTVLGPAALVAALVLGSVADPDPVLTITDPRITESSGLVDLGELMVTTNDSGDRGIVYVIDRSGRTVGTTRYGEAVDAEALAPGDRDHVWVGDIGDNRAVRPYVVVRRVPVGRGDRSVSVASYRLDYPDGPHDAETLLRQPGTGRMFVVTKGVLGGAVYAAPRRLDAHRLNHLRTIAHVGLFATDGSFLADGRHVLVRGYGSAGLYAFPGFRPLGSYDLPEQPQGETLSVGPRGRVRIGSEGARQPVLRAPLPPALASRLRPTRSPSASSSPPSRAGDTPRSHRQDDPVDDGTGSSVFVAVFGAIAVALGAMVAITRRRRRPG